ncbi:hypothetical protein Rsub_10007 [Raphidocelis subcapitata]|uniref:Cyanobacterial aminoacyl-tRNA synthetase CAAD domain-containing protein n=1 Tax=Raphidocelis subcapitata TaxID=307507 RepID=A0A2V0PBU3_9CHLO|nr:hypothetical protein Rsub_10007 [Raphidocelis subcapitata]|eukprot:GBF97316.1 hypothetical protein Rsub_10007 [Raphidocelis subcapitata]
MALLARQAARAGLARPTAARRTLALPSRPVVRANATKPAIDADELKEKATVFANDTAAALKERWEKTEDKPAAVLVISGTVVALSLALSVVNVVDKIPVVSSLIELVGISVTGWFTYRYLTVGPDRDELFVTIKELVNKIYGKL